MHLKCLVLDGRVAYTGSANFTARSRANWELALRLEGAPAVEAGAAVGVAWQRGRPLA